MKKASFAQSSKLKDEVIESWHLARPLNDFFASED